jgi:medium-chain acyl-[acyl-carrier-protein] hydrolase
MSVVTARSAWLRDLTEGTESGIRLFCVPHAGAGSLAYRRWPALVGPGVRLTAIQLPGREDRIAEPGYQSLSLLADDLVAVLASELDQPYALYGHSMGSVIAYEAARRIQASSAPRPAWLFCSGRAAAHLPWGTEALSGLPDDEFLQAVVRVNGFPAEVAAEEKLMQMIFPTLRCDFRLCDTYTHAPGPALDVPLTAFGGTDDVIAQSGLARWRELTTGPFRLCMVPGDHYAMTQGDELARAIRSDLSRAHGG